MSKPTNIMVLVAIFALTGCDLFTSVDDRIDRAEQAEKSGSYGEAMVELRNALDKEPKNPRAQLALARISYQLGNLDAASKALAAAQEAGAPATAVAPVKARVMLAQSDYEAVLGAINTGRLEMAEPELEVARIQALGGLNRCDEAIKRAEALTKAHPESTAQRIVAAECHGRHGNVSRAMAELETALRAHPKSADLLLAQGRILQLMERRSEAEKVWAQAAELAPAQLTVMQQVVLFGALVDLRIDRNDLAAARASQQQLDRVAPQGLVSQLSGARLAVASGELAETTRALRQLVTTVPDYPPVHLLLASALLADGSVEQGIRELDWLVARTPSQGFRQARESAGKLAAQKPQSEEYWLMVASVQLSLDQFGAARLALSRAQKVAPDSDRPRIAVGGIDLRTENFDAAAQVAESVLAKRPDDQVAILMLTQARVRTGRGNEALDSLEALWKRQPSAPLALALHRVRKEIKHPEPFEPMQRWLALHPDDIPMRGLYADGLRLAGDNRASIVEYEKLAASPPPNAATFNNLAWLYYLEHDPRAVATARRAHTLNPRSPSLADTLGWLLVESGNLKEGLPLIKAAYTATQGRSPEIRYHYAAALARSGDRAQARTLLNEMLATDVAFTARTDAEKLRGELERLP